MHELSIALDLIDVVSAEMARLGPVHVTSVHLRLGTLSGVMKEALIVSFDTAVMGTALDGARLQIDDVAVSVWCDACATERDLPDWARRRCPVCQSPTPRVIRGSDLELVALEIEDL